MTVNQSQYLPSASKVITFTCAADLSQRRYDLYSQFQPYSNAIINLTSVRTTLILAWIPFTIKVEMVATPKAEGYPLHCSWS